MSEPLPLILVLTDPNHDAEMIEELTQQYYDQLSDTIGDLVEDVVRVAAEPQAKSAISKGAPQQASGILQLDVNLEQLGKLGQWLYEKLAGKPIRVSLKIGDIAYEIDGVSQKDRQTVMQDMQAFVEKLKT